MDLDLHADFDSKTPRALSDAVWSEIDKTVSRIVARVRTCAARGCRVQFFPTDRRQRYCSRACCQRVSFAAYVKRIGGKAAWRKLHREQQQRQRALKKEETHHDL